MKRIEDNKKDHDFFKTPKIVIDSGLLARMKPSEIKVYLVIEKFADYKTGRAFPSIALICELSGMNKNVVCKAIKRLEHFGLIEKYRAPKGYKFHNVYRVLRNPKINPLVIPQKVEKESIRFRKEDGKWGVTPHDVEIDTFPQNMEGVIPQNMETDSFPQKVELHIFPQNMESKENEIELNRDRLIGPKKFSDVDIQLTQLLIDKILENDPKSRVRKMTKKTKNNWCDECRKLREIDERIPEEIKTVIIWSQEDSFEKTVVLSMTKLRKRFGELWLKCKRDWVEPEGKYRPQTYVGNQQPLTKEDEKFFPQIDKEYLKIRAAYMKKEGVDSEDDLPFEFPTLTDYRLKKIREMRKQRRIKYENI